MDLSVKLAYLQRLFKFNSIIMTLEALELGSKFLEN